MTVYRWLQSYYIMFWYIYYIYIIYVLIIAHMAFFWTLLGTLKDILTRQPCVFAESYVSCPFCKDNNTSSSFVWLCRFASRGIQNGPGCWCTQPTWMVGAWDWSWSRIDCCGWSHSLLEFFWITMTAISMRNPILRLRNIRIRTPEIDLKWSTYSSQ
jgi:hypothetical protein